MSEPTYLRTHPHLNARVARIHATDPPTPWARWVAVVGVHGQPHTDTHLGIYPFRWTARLALRLLLHPEALTHLARRTPPAPSS